MLNDLKFKTRDNGIDNLIIKEILKENVYRINESNVKDKIVLDIGANIGIFSVWVSQWAKKVFSFEPEKENYRYLLKNIKLNYCQNIIPVNKAVLDRNGVAVLKGEYGGAFIEGIFNKNTEKEQAVETITLDKIFNEYQIENCILKIDCEGSEYKIIEKANQLDKVEYLTMEYHKTNQKNFGNMMAKLSEFFNLHLFGSYKKGGYLYGKRY